MRVDSPLIGIVMRNYNAYHLTSECISSLQSTKYKNFIIFIIDDASKDNSPDLLSKNFPNVRILRSAKYVEYCVGLNRGARAALEERCEYVFFINNDTKDFSKLFFDELLFEFQKDKSIGLVGSKVRDYDGSILTDGRFKEKLGVIVNTPTEGFMIRGKVFETVGFLDEYLVRYFEDLDYIIRMRNKGWKTSYVGSVEFKHLGHGTSAKQPFVPQYYRSRNLLLFLKKHCSGQTIFWKCKNYIRYSRSTLSRTRYFIDKKMPFFFLLSVVAIILGNFMGAIKRWK